MAEKTVEELSVRISQDDMKGFVSLRRPADDQKYDFDMIMSKIAAKGLRYGVKEDVIREMVEGEQYNHERLVAVGTPSKDGIDGFFQLNFNLDFNTKPTIRPDGSVDYWSIHVVEIVEEGQVIAIYHEPVAGSNGMGVSGKMLIAKRGRPLPPLAGKGFTRSEDGKLYVADITGKIEKTGNRIQISPVYEVYGNVDLKTGNIDFRGDVLIHGNVLTGAEIRATGTVTIDGIVEAARIEAEKDIVLRGGVLGKGRAFIYSKSNISAKFIEYATVKAEGFLEASSALDCNIEIYDKVLMNSLNSTVVGGHIYAARGAEIYNCGNDSEMRTEIQVGMDKVMGAEVVTLQNIVREKQAMIDKLNIGLKQFEEMAIEKGVDISSDERRVGLLRARIATQAELAQAKEKLSYYDTIIESAKGATVCIMNNVHAGVNVTIDNITAIVKDTQHSVQFILREGKVIMIPVEY